MRCYACGSSYVVKLPYPRRGEEFRIRIRSWKLFRSKHRVVGRRP